MRLLFETGQEGRNFANRLITCAKPKLASFFGAFMCFVLKLLSMVGSARFELACGIPDLQSGAIDHSANFPILPSAKYTRLTLLGEHQKLHRIVASRPELL